MDFKFRSEFIGKNSNIISYDDKIFFIGSCFSNNIGNKLISSKFRCKINPLGVMYNPVSINNTIKIITGQKEINENDIFEKDGIYYSFFLHSSFNKLSREEFLNSLAKEAESALRFLETTSVVFITLGTAWVYKHRELDECVSNCHKEPAKAFDKIVMSSDDITSNLNEVVRRITEINPKVKIYFTLSPVRHLKDGFQDNSLSKALLRVAISNVIVGFENLDYFPAYEIVNDDLRDYRFYKDDLVHPNETAVNYIWSKFQDELFSDTTKGFVKRVDKINMALNHKVFNKKTLEYQRFLESTLNKIVNLKREVSSLEFPIEENHLSEELNMLKGFV